MKTKHPFSTSEVIVKAQTEIICALLRLLPYDEEIAINRMHVYLNEESFLPDGFFVKSVRLIEYGHMVEMTYRSVNHEKLDKTALNIQDLNEKDHPDLFIKGTETCTLKPSFINRDLLPLLVMIYEEAEKNLN